MLTDATTQERYSRHLNLAEIGAAGQRRLSDGHVAVVGVGGLGSPAAYYLVAAGVGTVTLIDGDVVDESNLQRQILHSTPDIGVKKVVSASQRLQRLNPHVTIRTFDCRLGEDNAEPQNEAQRAKREGGSLFFVLRALYFAPPALAGFPHEDPDPVLHLPDPAHEKITPGPPADLDLYTVGDERGEGIQLAGEKLQVAFGSKVDPDRFGLPG